LSFKSILVEKKIEVVSRAISGEKVRLVAREIGVHGVSVCTWKERVLSAFEKTLEPS